MTSRSDRQAFKSPRRHLIQFGMERPAKKPRLQGPDGFQKPKSTSHYKPPESITKFVSAFDNNPKLIAQPKRPSERRPVNHEQPRNPFLDSRPPKEPEAGPSRPSLPKRQLKSSSLAHPPRAIEVDKTRKVLKPPMFLPPAAPQPSSKTAGVGPTLFQPVFKRPPARSILKPPPVPVPSGARPSVPLKPLAPPPPLPLLRPASPKKPMKTILTTNIAQATDPTKEGTGAELLSLFLQQHGHNFMSSTDRELQRGVMTSPDKRSRGKDPKFLRYVLLVIAISISPFRPLLQGWPGGTLPTSHLVYQNRLYAMATTNGTENQVWVAVWVRHAASHSAGARRGQSV